MKNKVVLCFSFMAVLMSCVKKEEITKFFCNLNKKHYIRPMKV